MRHVVGASIGLLSMEIGGMTPTDSFVEAMRRLLKLNDRDDYRDLPVIRQAAEAFADQACLTTARVHDFTANGSCKGCRTALLKRVMGESK